MRYPRDIPRRSWPAGTIQNLDFMDEILDGHLW